jgi:hypothetical protein
LLRVYSLLGNISTKPLLSSIHMKTQTAQWFSRKSAFHVSNESQNKQAGTVSSLIQRMNP